jgi:hypothetical protein
MVYRLEDWSSIPCRGVRSPLHCVQIGSGANTTSYPIVTGALPKGIKRPKRGADHSPRHSAEVKNGRAIYIYSLIRLHGAVLHYLNTDTSVLSHTDP